MHGAGWDSGRTWQDWQNSVDLAEFGRSYRHCGYRRYFDGNRSAEYSRMRQIVVFVTGL